MRPWLSYCGMDTRTREERTRGADLVELEDKPLSARRRGRPEEYSEQNLPRVLELVFNGANDVEIAKDLGIGVSTLYTYYGRHPDFLEAVKAAKDIYDDRAERTLYSRATGSDPDTQVSDTALIFWLRNRRREKWNAQSDLSLVLPIDDQQHMKNVNEPTDLELAVAALALIHEARYNKRPAIEGQATEVRDGRQGDQGRAGRAEAGEGSQQVDPLEDDPDFDFEERG